MSSELQQKIYDDLGPAEIEAQFKDIVTHIDDRADISWPDVESLSGSADPLVLTRAVGDFDLARFRHYKLIVNGLQGDIFEPNQADRINKSTLRVATAFGDLALRLAYELPGESSEVLLGMTRDDQSFRGEIVDWYALLTSQVHRSEGMRLSKKDAIEIKHAIDVVPYEGGDALSEVAKQIYENYTWVFNLNIEEHFRSKKAIINTNFSKAEGATEGPQATGAETILCQMLEEDTELKTLYMQYEEAKEHYHTKLLDTRFNQYAQSRPQDIIEARKLVVERFLGIFDLAAQKYKSKGSQILSAIWEHDQTFRDIVFRKISPSSAKITKVIFPESYMGSAINAVSEAGSTSARDAVEISYEADLQQYEDALTAPNRYQASSKGQRLMDLLDKLSVGPDRLISYINLMARVYGFKRD